MKLARRLSVKYKPIKPYRQNTYTINHSEIKDIEIFTNEQFELNAKHNIVI